MTVKTRPGLDAEVAVRAAAGCVCGRPGCTGRKIAIAARCHQQAGLHAVYSSPDGQLILLCSTCGLAIASIQVAWAVPS